MHLRYIFPVLVLIANLNGFAQTNLKNAQREMSLFNYFQAVELLKKEVVKDGDKPKCEVVVLLADCYRLLNDVTNAKKWYSKAIALNDQCRITDNPGPIIYYYYAQALRSSGEYMQAKKFFLRYDSLVPGQHLGNLVASFCDSAFAWQTIRPAFEIRNEVTLNSPQSEFGTVLFHQGIIFTSDRICSTETKNKYGWTGNSYLNQYYSEPVNMDSISGGFKIPKPFKDLPDQAWHVGPVSFNHDFTEVFLNQTKLNHDKGKKNQGSIRTHLLKIFYSVFHDGKWSLPEPFFLNSDDYSVGHPALTRDGNTLYFVSDMPGGYGQTDIWFCKREGNGWSKPVNPGPVINTPGKEMFPFVALNGDLYFASDGLPGFGGLDLFLTRKTENQWSTPHNMGCPVNSSYDDLSLVISDDNMSGFFSSNRPGGAGSDDIYSFRKLKSGDSPGPIPIATISTKDIPADTPGMDTLKINKNYRLENIFYDFDKWDIRDDAKPSLDKLVGILKEYPINIELGSHTDCRGTETYNMQLSQKRAESAVQYIISRGIVPSRITAKGYGKSRLINHCNCAEGMKCTDAEHQENRRTEFKVTGMEVNHPQKK